MVDDVMQLDEGTKIQLLAPVVRKKGRVQKTFRRYKKAGYVRVRVDKEVVDVNEPIELDKNKKHNIEIVVDRIIVKPNIQKRLADSIETVLKLSNGILVVDVIGKEEILFSQNFACTECGISMEELTPRMFSFNNPYGACPSCTGLGSLLKADPDLIIPNKKLSLKEGAIAVAGWNVAKDDSYASMYMNALTEQYNFSLSTPVEDLPEHILDIILYGTKEKDEVEYDRKYGNGTFMASFEGIVNSVERRYNETHKEGMKQYYEQFMSENMCLECNGARLKKEVLAVTVCGKNIHEISCMSVGEVRQFFNDIDLSERDRMIAHQILKEINERLGFLVDVGLDYLTLSRAAGTLSGGEAQRIRLATQIGSGLMGVLYILDEPSIGLHQRDNEKLLRTLKKMRDLGNTLIVVEHDEDTMYAADHIVDLGPGAGIHGGKLLQGEL